MPTVQPQYINFKANQQQTNQQTTAQHQIIINPQSVAHQIMTNQQKSIPQQLSGPSAQQQTGKVVVCECLENLHDLNNRGILLYDINASSV